jgi:hypothetical protein
MKTLVLAMSIFGLGSVACGYIDGPCWRRSEDGAGVGSGVGGGPIVPGVGGSYGVSPEPQNAGMEEDIQRLHGSVQRRALPRQVLQGLRRVSPRL